MAEQITLKDHSHERSLYLSRLILGGVIALLLVAVLIFRLVFLQVDQFEYYSSKSDSYRIHVQPIVPTRGLIYDRNGVLLAENRSTSSLILVKENAGDIETSIEILTTLIELSEADIDSFRTRLQRRRVPFSSVPVRFDLTEEEIARIAVNQFRLPGISVQAQLIRHYPQKAILAHAVGYMGSISEEELQRFDAVNYRGTFQSGKMGIERFYESILHGQAGYETVERNARGQTMKVLDRTDPVPGQDIVLNLDINLQRAATLALGEFRGGVIALDVNDGGVLAMVSTPSFDPNLFVEGISQSDYSRLNDSVLTPLFNRALAKYSPGSTVKPFVGLASLDTGVRTKEYTIYDPGYFQLSNESHIFRDWTWRSSRNGHEEVNLEKAIYVSCNTYFYDLAAELGINRMHDFMYQFGFGRNTSIDIPQASVGILPSQQWLRETRGESWYPGYTLNSGIGQGFTEMTSLQLATATMVLANKGKWAQPAMLRRMGLEGENIVRQSIEPDVILQNQNDWDFMAGAMEKVIHRGDGGYRDNGSAWAYIDLLDPLAYRMAGKSGTAQVVNNAADEFLTDDDVIESRRPHALFIAFAPVDNPQIAIAVFVEHGEAGSSVAGPIARKILDAYLLEDGELKEEYRTVDTEEGLQVSSLTN